MTHSNNPKMILGGIKSISKTETDFMIEYETGEKAKINILNQHVFKYFMSPKGEFPEYPEPQNPNDIAKINVKRVSDYDVKAFEEAYLVEHAEYYSIHSDKIKIEFDKLKGLMTVYDKRANKQVMIEAKPLSYANYKSKQILKQHKDEYYYGGGMQNGRFSHKGEIIRIVNTNNWVDGGVTSPCPFYWSTYGYGVLRNTWQPGRYDFGSQSHDIIKTIHKGEDFDAFYFISAQPKDILNDYFELTGQPIFMPEYAFYEAHLNAFNRDYWVKVSADTPGAIQFEDGEYYKSYKPNEMEDKTGILESLNGEKNNYQFSARAMIDRYKRHDVPLGWFVPNDGYGSGYGQTNSLDGDVQNLKEFADYARQNGVEVALWTESQLEPKDPKHPKKGERDLSKEVGVAGVVALKCDVAWIGSGYSFGLSAVENAANIFVRTAKNTIRPLIIMVDGWAGTQRYSGIWSGDQKGGEWEYIRFHIPTYIGTGLSGQPIVGSDMDGIYAGKSRLVNIRDYQWKAFTPLQLNMDGWGNIPKTPFSFDDEATGINRAYLKQKSMLLPYIYSIGHESTHGLPMIRAMFLEFPEEISAYTDDSKYQYMWGPNLLVAPIYNLKGVTDASIRDGIYFPDPNQVWIDFFTGEKYQGGKIYNNIKTPLWKIPVFVKDGAIIPMTNPNNNPTEVQRYKRIFNVYPNAETTFELYEDDGKSSDYLEGHFAKTKVSVIGPKSNQEGDLFVTVHPTQGSYKNIIKERTTLLCIMASKDTQHIKAAINGETIKLNKVKTEKEFEQNENVYYFKEDYAINPYLNELSREIWKQKFFLIKIQKTDITTSQIQIKIKDYINKDKVFGSIDVVNKALNAPTDLAILEINLSSVTLHWQPDEDAMYYDIERDGTIFTNIIGSTFTFEGFKYETNHLFRIRSVNDEGVSIWSSFVTAVIGADPHKYVIKDVKVTCNIPCQNCEEVCNLTDGDPSSVWHTHWDMPNQACLKTGKVIKLNFDLREVYSIEKVEYVPREDAGNGTILKLQYRYSVDGKNWSPLSNEIYWNCDKKVKTIEFDKSMRYVEFVVLDSVGGFGSGRQILFYHNVIVKGVKASCNIPCEPGEEINKLTDGNLKSLWHTKWDMPNQTDPKKGKFINLNFNLGDVYEIDKVEYLPRENAGNGNFFKVQYKISDDGVNWSPVSDVISWDRDGKNKTIPLDGAKVRFMELHVLDSSGGFGSGRQVLFYKKID